MTSLSIQERHELNDLFSALERARKPFIIRFFKDAFALSLKNFKKLSKRNKHQKF